MFDYIDDIDLRWALEESYNFCIKKEYLVLFTHPAIKLHQGLVCSDNQHHIAACYPCVTLHEGSRCGNNQHHVVTAHMPQPQEIDSEKWNKWLVENDIDDITLQDRMTEITEFFDRVYNRCCTLLHDKSVRSLDLRFHTCHTTRWVFDNLRLIALYGLKEHQEKYANYWDINEYNKLVKNNIYETLPQHV